MAAPTEDLIDRLTAAAVECKQLLREVHGATRDLRVAVREGEEAQRRLKDDFASWVESQWNQRAGIDMLASIKTSYLHWVDITGDVDKTMDALHALERKINRRLVEMGTA